MALRVLSEERNKVCLCKQFAGLHMMLVPGGKQPYARL